MNDNRPDLLILAAGIGSRYGGLKQLDGCGPNGETIMDYSIYDAIRSGFRKIVFVIKEAHLDLFETQIVRKFKSQIEIGYAFQDLDDLPKGMHLPASREKPWGTGHAILSARNEISRPFAVINADDFYGYSAFQTMSDELSRLTPLSREFLLMGYEVANTLSEHGSVSRGRCRSENGYLTGINELTRISKSENRIIYREDGVEQLLEPDAIVSMNFWGFTPLIFELLEKGFVSFIKRNLSSPIAEFFITESVDDAIKKQLAYVRLLATNEKWLGITYFEDKAAVANGIQTRIDEGSYPATLAPV
jgi:dTDP-glucose pyrophosphorylase